AEGEAPEPVEIQAETLEFQGDHYQASGGVTVLQGGRKLTEASMAFDRATGELSAEGEVRLEDGGDLLASPKILWNLKTQTAILHDGSLHLRKDNFHIRGRLIRRESPELYTIDTAVFTTCDGSPPSWQFRGKDIQVRLNHFLTARHVSFAVADLPVLYFPYMVLPIQQTRQTGLLIPRVGYNTGEGLKVNTAFFWAVSPNQDATFYGDYYGEKGLGGGLEYRYLLSRETGGTFNGYFLRDRQVDQDRWRVQYRHVQAISERSTARLNLNTLSDKTIYKDISEETADRLLRSQDSDFYLNRRWETASAHLWAQYTQDLIGETREVFQRLPEAGITVGDRRIGPLPLFYALRSSVNRWEREAGDLVRSRIAPELSARIPLGPVGWIPRARIQEIYYAPVDGGETTQRTLTTLQMDLHAKAYRTFPGAGVKHLMEPTVRYETTEIRSSGPTPPSLDLLEETREEGRVTLILLNRWITLPSKEDKAEIPDGEPGESSRREAVMLRLSQNYRVTGAADPDEESTARSGPFRAEMVFRPLPPLSIDVDARYRHAEERLDAVHADLRWELEKGFLEVWERYTHAPALRFVTAGGGYRIRNLDARFEGWYDARDHVLREGKTSLDVPLQCWGVTFTYTYRPEERQFNVLFTLKGVGSVGR
ncbi:MAG: LPS assembly protein LptD, partial [Nitrospirae bacterium]|nr:LPS assembly protein LptD [Nitrospirota bacterium]